MTIKITGNWNNGLVYDIHTVGSNYLGPDEFGCARWDNTRSEMGELVYQLKYKSNKLVLEKIINLLEGIEGVEEFDAIIPAPSTNRSRTFQPVDEIALMLGERKNVIVLIDFLMKKPGGQQLKDVSDPSVRMAQLKNTIYLADSRDISGKKILLIDDLYRSGSTLSVATDSLYSQAKADKVCVLAMTKTKSIR